MTGVISETPMIKNMKIIKILGLMILCGTNHNHLYAQPNLNPQNGIPGNLTPPVLITPLGLPPRNDQSPIQLGLTGLPIRPNPQLGITGNLTPPVLITPLGLPPRDNRSQRELGEYGREGLPVPPPSARPGTMGLREYVEQAKQNGMISEKRFLPWGKQGKRPVQPRERILNALNSIKIPKAGPFNNFTIEETLQVLSQFGQRQAINFIYSPQLGHQEESDRQDRQFQQRESHLVAPLVDQETGLPLPFPANTEMPIQDNLPPQPIVKNQFTELYNLSLKQLLDILTMQFDPPMSYSVMDWGVVIYKKDPKQARFIIRGIR